MNNDIFLKRIDYQGDIKTILLRVCDDFDFGKYYSHLIVSVGYEDLNIILLTDKGKYFIKIFAKFRDEQNCKRYVEIITRALKAGVRHPKLFKSHQGYLYEIKIDSVMVRLCVMQYIDGKSFYDLNVKPTKDNTHFFIQQAALINKINLQPSLVYDSWAIVNFLKEYEQKKQYLVTEDDELIKPLVQRFSALNIDKLPHCLVHGDIIKTNVIQDKSGNIYILDFSVANYYPRIQELAVLLCNLLFDEDSPDNFVDYYNLALSDYQKHIVLTPEEISAMPLYTKVAHAMHIICANYEKVANRNNTIENSYWLKIGRIGLRYTSKLWLN